MATIIYNIDKAAALLTANKAVAIPTETVYGLAANIYSTHAVEQIYSIKQRPLYNPLIVHIASIDHLDKIASYVPSKALQLARAFWPGPLTLVLKKQPTVPDIVTGGKDTVAVRVPDHPLTLSLLNAIDFPLAAPSANPFGTISPTTASHVANYFKNEDIAVLDGGVCQRGVESTIVGFHGDDPVIYRLGAIAPEQIAAIAGDVEVANKHLSTAPNAPGMLLKHYAPLTPSLLTSDVAAAIIDSAGKKIGVLAYNNVGFVNSDVQHVEVLSLEGDLEEACSKLYAALHELDAKGLDIIIMEQMPNNGLGLTINDRLQRAATR